MSLKRLLAFVLVILFCGSVAGNFGLLRLSRRLYADALLSQIWPEGQPPEVAVETEAPGGKTVLLLGDSRVANWGSPQLRNFRVINAGAPGLTSAQVCLRCRQWLEKIRPDIVVIQVGINDLKVLGVRPELRQPIVFATASNLTAIVEQCRRAGSRVLVLAIWPGIEPAGLRRVVWSDQVNEAVAEVNQKLQNLTADPDSLRVFDLLGELRKKSSPDNCKKLYRDTLHLTTEAYARLSPLLETSIQPWLAIDENARR